MGMIPTASVRARLVFVCVLASGAWACGSRSSDCQPVDRDQECENGSFCEGNQLVHCAVACDEECGCTYERMYEECVFGCVEPEDGPLSCSEGPREIASFEVSRTCPGCLGVQWCELPLSDESTTVTLSAAPNQETGLLFPSEQYEAIGRPISLLEGCRWYAPGVTLTERFEAPWNATVLDAGTITVTGDMDAMSEPMTTTYGTLEQGYEPTTRPVELDQYRAAVELVLEAEGGSNLPSFEAQALSTEPFEILEPSVDSNGQVVNFENETDLEIRWSGGGGFDDVVIIVEAFSCPSQIEGLLACRVENDGDFTIPGPVVSRDAITDSDVVMLHLIRSRQIPLDVEGLDGELVWSIRSSLTVPLAIK